MRDVKPEAKIVLFALICLACLLFGYAGWQAHKTQPRVRIGHAPADTVVVVVPKEAWTPPPPFANEMEEVHKLARQMDSTERDTDTIKRLLKAHHQRQFAPNE